MATVVFKSNQSEACRLWRTTAKCYLSCLQAALRKVQSNIITTEDEVETAGNGQTEAQAHFLGMTEKEQTVYTAANDRFQNDMQAIIDGGPIVP